jgi:hypothetical protein
LYPRFVYQILAYREDIMIFFRLLKNIHGSPPGSGADSLDFAASEGKYRRIKMR